MAADSEKDASEGLGGARNTGEKDHKRGSSSKLTEADRRKRKQECQRNSNANKKQNHIKTQKKLAELTEKCAYYQGQVDACYKWHVDACYKGIREELANVVDKQTAQIEKLGELIIEEKHSAGRRGSTSSSTEMLEGAPNQLAYNSLMERYIASETHHAQEKADIRAQHAQEIADIRAQHAQEIDAINAHHGQAMAAVRTEYGLDVENEILQAPAGASPGIDDVDQYLNYDLFTGGP